MQGRLNRPLRNRNQKILLFDTPLSKTYSSRMVNDKRRYPRVNNVFPRQVFRLDPAQNPVKNLVLTENLSACGIKFVSQESMTPATYFLIYLNDAVLAEIKQSGANWIRSGDQYLAKVIWSKAQEQSQAFEVGACFLEKSGGDVSEIQTLTELINLSTLESLPETQMA